MHRPPPRPTLFPYTTLFRSQQSEEVYRDLAVHVRTAGHVVDVAVDEFVPSFGGFVDLEVFFDGIGPWLERDPAQDRKSTRLNSSHVEISYAVFCLKKKK